MANRMELQNKGVGVHRDKATGKSAGPGTSHAGISRDIRNNKRAEATERNSNTPLDRTKKYRLASDAQRAAMVADKRTVTAEKVTGKAETRKPRNRTKKTKVTREPGLVVATEYRNKREI